MHVRVLGSAAGGGLPQWNCACLNCASARAGTLAARTQDSLAVSLPNGWALLNCSPDVRQQLAAAPALAPRSVRGSSIRAIVLTSGDIDHVAGLLSLREEQPLTVYATAAVFGALVERNQLLRTLTRNPGQLTWRPLQLGRAQPLGDDDSVQITALPAAGKLPPHQSGQVAPSVEDNVALLVTDEITGRSLVYAPGVAEAAPLLADLPAVDCLFLDGTFHDDDELVRLGLGKSTATRLAHQPIAGKHGTLSLLAAHPSVRKIYTHLNNSNPVLADSPERHAVLSAGVEIAFDGLELAL